MKSLVKYGVLLVILGCAIYFMAYRLGDSKYKYAANKDELYAMMTADNLEFKKHCWYVMDFEPTEFDYQRMVDNLVAVEPYKGTNFYGFEYIYKMRNGQFYMNMDFYYYLNKLQYFLADARIAMICKKIKHLSDYEKVKAIHDYVVRYCEYSVAGNGAYNTLYQGFAVCNGYALSFYRIMEKSGIPVTFEVGGNHAWNRVFVDGYWYNIDLTWDDGGGREVNYDYFLKSDADWAGHEHGGADAPKSHEITGPSAEENYKMFPPYQFILYIVMIVGAIALLFGGAAVWHKGQQRKRAKRIARQNAEYEEYLRGDDYRY